VNFRVVGWTYGRPAREYLFRSQYLALIRSIIFQLLTVTEPSVAKVVFMGAFIRKVLLLFARAREYVIMAPSGRTTSW